MGWLGIALVAALAAGRGGSPAGSTDPPGAAVADTVRSAAAPAAAAAAAAAPARTAPDSIGSVPVDSLYSRAVAAGRALAPRDRRVLEELLAAVREMQAVDDHEAAAVLIRDALDYIAERRP